MAIAPRLQALVILAVLATADSAFADKVKLVIYSDPAGATVYANNSKQMIGYSPVILEYNFAKDFFKRGRCESLQTLQVRWASGAEATIDGLSLCGKQGKNQQFTFVRPPETPGREIDAYFALQLQQLAIIQGQAEADRSAYIAGLYASAAARRREIEEQRRPVNCYSTLIGSTVYTTCR